MEGNTQDYKAILKAIELAGTVRETEKQVKDWIMRDCEGLSTEMPNLVEGEYEFKDLEKATDRYRKVEVYGMILHICYWLEHSDGFGAAWRIRDILMERYV